MVSRIFLAADFLAQPFLAQPPLYLQRGQRTESSSATTNDMLRQWGHLSIRANSVVKLQAAQLPD